MPYEKNWLLNEELERCEAERLAGELAAEWPKAMPDCPSPPRLIAYAAGKSDPAEVAAIEPHVRLCDYCERCVAIYIKALRPDAADSIEEPVRPRPTGRERVARDAGRVRPAVMPASVGEAETKMTPTAMARDPRYHEHLLQMLTPWWAGILAIAGIPEDRAPALADAIRDRLSEVGDNRFGHVVVGWIADFVRSETGGLKEIGADEIRRAIAATAVRQALERGSERDSDNLAKFRRYALSLRLGGPNGIRSVEATGVLVDDEFKLARRDLVREGEQLERQGLALLELI